MPKNRSPICWHRSVSYFSNQQETEDSSTRTQVFPLLRGELPPMQLLYDCERFQRLAVLFAIHFSGQSMKSPAIPQQGQTECTCGGAAGHIRALWQIRNNIRGILDSLNQSSVGELFRQIGHGHASQRFFLVISLFLPVRHVNFSENAL